jgi:hypothetical protein
MVRGALVIKMAGAWAAWAGTLAQVQSVSVGGNGVPGIFVSITSRDHAHAVFHRRVNNLSFRLITRSPSSRSKLRLANNMPSSVFGQSGTYCCSSFTQQAGNLLSCIQMVTISPIRFTNSVTIGSISPLSFAAPTGTPHFVAKLRVWRPGSSVPGVRYTSTHPAIPLCHRHHIRWSSTGCLERFTNSIQARRVHVILGSRALDTAVVSAAILRVASAGLRVRALPCQRS